MDWSLTPDQELLRQSVRAFLRERCPPAVVRALAATPAGYSAAMWAEMARLGWLGLVVPERYGGADLGLVELALVLEEMGYAAFPGPYVASAVLAASALRLGGTERQKERWLGRIATGEAVATVGSLTDPSDIDPDRAHCRAEPSGSDVRLSGVARFVPFAHAADVLLLPARLAGRPAPLVLVERTAPGLTIAPMPGIDATTRWSAVTLQDVRVPAESVLRQPDGAPSLMEAVLEWAAVGAAAEMLGAARRCLDMSVAYAKVREQFGQPIGAFQAIKHKCAEMLVDVETATWATYYAAWAVDAQAPDAPLAVGVAKSYVSDAARRVCGEAIQVHGGVGFTWEYDLHLFFKRAKALEPLFGDAELHRERIVRRLLAQPAGGAA